MKNLRLVIIAALCMHGMVHAAGKQTATAAVTTVEQAEKQYAQLIGNAQQNQNAIRTLITTVRAIPGVRSAVWANEKTNALDAKLKAPAVAKGKPTTVAAPKQPATKPVTPAQQLPVAQKPAAPIAVPAIKSAQPYFAKASKGTQPQGEQKRVAQTAQVQQPAAKLRAVPATLAQSTRPVVQRRPVDDQPDAAPLSPDEQPDAAPSKLSVQQERKIITSLPAAPQAQPQRVQTEVKRAAALQTTQQAAAPVQQLTIRERIAALQQKNTQAAQVKQPAAASVTKPALDTKPKKVERNTGLFINKDGKLALTFGTKIQDADYFREKYYIGEKAIHDAIYRQPLQALFDLIAPVQGKLFWQADDPANYLKALQTLPEKTRKSLILHIINNNSPNSTLPFLASMYKKAQISYRVSPLVWAFVHNKDDIVQMLLDSGAVITADVFAELALSALSPELSASDKIAAEKIALLCTIAAPVINDKPVRFAGRPVLNIVLGFAFDHPEIIQALLDCGADPYKQETIAKEYLQEIGKENVNAFDIAQMWSDSVHDDRSLKVLENWRTQQRAQTAQAVTQPGAHARPLPGGVARLIAEYAEEPVSAAPTQVESKTTAAKPKLTPKEQDAANNALLNADSMEAIEDALAHQANINAASPAPKQITRLMRAAEQGDDHAVRRLIALGASINQTDYVGETALIKAVKNNRIDVVRTLVNAGADSQIRARAELGESEGKTALQYAKNKPEILDILNLGQQLQDVD